MQEAVDYVEAINLAREARNRLARFAKAKDILVRWSVPGQGYTGENCTEDIRAIVLGRLTRNVVLAEEKEKECLKLLKAQIRASG